MEPRGGLWSLSLTVLLATVVWFAYAFGHELGEQAGFERSHDDLNKLRITIWDRLARATPDDLADQASVSGNGAQFASGSAGSAGSQSAGHSR